MFSDFNGEGENVVGSGKNIEGSQFFLSASSHVSAWEISKITTFCEGK
jgi:hypothetical protein